MHNMENAVFNDRYKITSKSSSNSIRDIYRGLDTTSGSLLRFTFINPNVLTHFEVDKMLFANELATIKTFDNSHLLRVLEAQDYNNSFVVISDYFDSQNLQELFDAGRTFSVDEALQIVSQLGSALSYAYSKGIIHKGIRPADILIAEDNGSLLVKLLGFGVQYIIDYMNAPSEEVEVNFGYMSPEASGLLDRKVDHRSDLYSIGVLLYRLLTGVMPFTANSIDAMVYQHVAIIPKAPSELNSEIPEEISLMAMRLLTKDPDLRYQSADDLVNDIDKYLYGEAYVNGVASIDILRSMDERARILGRAKEQKKISAICRDILDSGKGNICVVRGELGSGQSDLINNYCRQMEEENICFIRTRFSSSSNLTPYFAFSDILNKFIEIFENYTHKQQIVEKTRLARLLGGLTSIVFRINSDMHYVLPESLVLPSLDGYKELQRSKDLLTEFFLALFPQDHPYVLVFEDLHLADSASLQLISSMASQVFGHPVFLLCSYRDGQISEASFLDNFLTDLHNNVPSHIDLPLNPYNDEEMSDFVSHILYIRKEDCRVLSSYLLQKTDGNPYFTVNILRSMLEDGIISVSGSGLDQNWEQLHALTDSKDLTDIISRKMENMSPEGIEFFGAAAVIGREFSLHLLHTLTGLDKSISRNWINQAMTLQFIEYSSTREFMRFTHSRIYECFLDSVPAEKKRFLHLHIAQHIESASDDPMGKDIYSIIYHYIQSESAADIKRYIMQAAIMARNAHANEDAIRYYKLALDIIRSGDDAISAEECRNAKLALTELNLTIGNVDEALVTAEELLSSMTDPLQKASLYRYIGVCHFRQSSFDKCEENLVKALSCLAFRIPTSQSKIRLYLKTRKLSHHMKSLSNIDKIADRLTSVPSAETSCLILTLFELSRLYSLTNGEKFTYICLRAYRYMRKETRRFSSLAPAYYALGGYYLSLGNYRSAESFIRSAVDQFKSDGYSYGEAASLYLYGILSQWKGEFRKSIKDFNDSASVYETIGDLWEYTAVRCLEAVSLRLSGNYEKSNELCLKNIENTKKIRDNFNLSVSYATMANNYIEMGNFPQAEDYVNQASQLSGTLNIPFADSFVQLALGRFFLETEKYDRAMDLLTKSMETLDKHTFIIEYSASVYSYLVLAKIHHLDLMREGLDRDEIMKLEDSISSLCATALEKAEINANLMIPAYRATALYGIMTERFNKTEQAYINATHLAATTESKFQYAMAHFDYGSYLLSKHRTVEARFHIFEAYMTFSKIECLRYEKICEDIISTRYQEDFSSNALLENTSAMRNRMNIDRKIKTLLKLGERLTSTLEVEELQKQILQDAVELVGAERGILFLYPETGEKRLYVASIFNLGNFDANTYDWMLEEVVKNRKAVTINDVQSDQYRKHYTVMVRYGIKSVMAMPMFVRGNLFGVIYMDSRLARGIFSEEYDEALSFIADQAGAPIENARLYHRAITDGLTGIYGRSYLDNLIIDKTSSPNVKLSALMLDVDHFKKCNDTYGHQVGDKVLKQVASALKRITGEMGTACRYGGEEFVCLLDTDNAELACKIAERIRMTIENTTVAFNEGNKVVPVSVTISIGVSIWSPDMERVELVEHADKALYYAKGHGRNQVVLWTPQMTESK